MKEKKPKVLQKSIRMTEDTYQFIKGFSGKKSFAEDLDELIYYFKFEKEQIKLRKVEIEELEKQKDCLHQEVNELMFKINKIHEIEQTIKSLYEKVGDL